MAIDIERLQAKLVAASPGPWIISTTKVAYLPSIGGPDGRGGWTRLMDQPAKSADANLIVAAVNSLPELLEELIELRKLKETL